MLTWMLRMQGIVAIYSKGWKWKQYIPAKLNLEVGIEVDKYVSIITIAEKKHID